MIYKIVTISEKDVPKNVKSIEDENEYYTFYCVDTDKKYMMSKESIIKKLCEDIPKMSAVTP